MNHQKLTALRASELLDYDAETGALTWKVRAGRVSAGAKVCSVDGHGYLVVRIDKVRYLAHRVAWLIANGGWPDKGLDHIDGNRLNNALKNLREATAAENNQNKRAPISSNKSSQSLGVSRNKKSKKWVAYISVSGLRKHLGSFENEASARAAYLAAKADLHPFAEVKP
jgi:hypothetical protein